MNIIVQLKKQIEIGKTLVLENGTTVKPEDANKPLMKEYLAGLKSGKITPDISFNDYCENNKGELLTVQEILDFIEGTDCEE
ncbi:MAG: hypothetical protein ACI4WG_05235 [Erysipelotrichaceae bacterium]